MTRILVVTDADWVRNDVHAALSVGDNELIDQTDPAATAAMAFARDVDVVIVDLQVGAMGGMAVTRAMKDAGIDSHAIPVVMLLDRGADTFLAGRAGADGWVVKPFTARQLRDAMTGAIGSAA